MTYTIERLVSDVMARLGEVEASRPPEGGDIPWPEDIIGLKVRAMLPEVGARLILGWEAPQPPTWGVECASFRKKLMPCGMYGVEVRLPEGFLRMVSVKVEGWVNSVGSVVMPGDAEWSRQWSAEPGIAGSPERPRAYLDCDGEGMLLRLVGSESEDAELEWLSYLSVPTISEEGEFDFPSMLYPTLVGEIVLSL